MLLLHFFVLAAPRERWRSLCFFSPSPEEPCADSALLSTQVAREAEEVEQCTVSAGFLARDAQQDLDEAMPAMQAAAQVRIRQHLFRIRQHTSAYVGQELRMPGPDAMPAVEAAVQARVSSNLTYADVC